MNEPPNEQPQEAPPVAQARLIAGPGTAFAPAAPPATSWLPETVSNIPPLSPAAAPDPPLAWPTAAPAARSSIDAGIVPPFESHRTTRLHAVAMQRQNSHVTMIVMLAGSLVALAVGAGSVLVWQSNQITTARQGQTAAPDEATTPSSKSVANSPLGAHAAADSRPRENASRAQQSAGPTAARTDPTRSAASTKTPVGLNPSKANEPPTGDQPQKQKTPDNPLDAPVDPALTKLVDTTLVAAREALAARDLDKADEQLDLALLDASTDSLRARVEGVKTLRHFVGGFWNAVHEHLQKIAAGTELDVEGEIMVVVEVNRQDDILFVRRRGERRLHKAANASEPGRGPGRAMASQGR